MEESPMPTHVPADFNLQNWATIAVAAALWNKSRVTFFFYSKHGCATDDYIRLMVKKNKKTLHCLPRQIANQILCTFKCLGQRIALWCDYAENVMRIPRNVAAALHWTVYGTIDEGKILQNCIDSKMIQHEDPEQTQAVYYAACCNVCIDYITFHWEKILEFCDVYIIYPSLQNKISNKYIICSVIFLAKLESSQLPEAQIQYFNDFNYKEKRNMFMLSVKEGCPQAARYYWSLLSGADKKDLIIRAAILSLDSYRKSKYRDYFICVSNLNDLSTPKCNVYFARYKNNCFADLLIFFITHMSQVEIRELFDYLNQLFEHVKEESIDAIFDVLIHHWPLEEFLPLTYDVVLERGETPTSYTSLIVDLLKAMNRNKDLGLCNRQKFHQTLFKALWNKLRKYNTCEEILGTDWFLSDLICNLFDLEVLKLIIDNCEDKYRKTFITKTKTALERLVGDNKFELLRKFMDDVLRFNDEDEEEWFRNTCVKCFNLVISKTRHREIYCPNEKQKQILNQQLAISLCEVLLKYNRIELADSCLKSIFNSEEEKENYIKDFIANKISRVTSIGESKNTDFVDCIPIFFRWLLKSGDEAIQIQQEKLISQNSLKNLLFALLIGSWMKESEIYKIIDEFLLFCLSPKKVAILKREIRNELPNWIKFLHEECCSEDGLDDILNWII